MIELTNVIMILLVIMGFIFGIIITMIFGIVFFSYQNRRIKKEVAARIDLSEIKKKITGESQNQTPL